MKDYEYWDIGEESPFPNLGKTSTARVMQALIRLGGRLHDTDFDDQYEADHHCSVVYRISLPVGTEKDFEDLAGYPLTPLPRVGVQTTEQGKFVDDDDYGMRGS